MDESKRLRALLDEHGIEWWNETDPVPQRTTVAKVGDELVIYHENTDGTVGYSRHNMHGLTPEQAIAATVGTEPDEATMLKLHGRMNAALLDMNEELLAYHPQDRENASSKELIDCVIRAHQIIEDAATAGVGTCKGEIDTDYFECKLTWFECKGCGWSGVVDNICVGYSFDGTDMPRYCPNCGKRIIEEVAE